jgi:hypothetical protein
VGPDSDWDVICGGFLYRNCIPFSRSRARALNCYCYRHPLSRTCCRNSFSHCYCYDNRFSGLWLSDPRVLSIANKYGHSFPCSRNSFGYGYCNSVSCTGNSVGYGYCNSVSCTGNSVGYRYCNSVSCTGNSVGYRYCNSFPCSRNSFVYGYSHAVSYGYGYRDPYVRRNLIGNLYRLFISFGHVDRDPDFVANISVINHSFPHSPVNRHSDRNCVQYPWHHCVTDWDSVGNEHSFQ